ncbi:MFS transporter [Massilia yuzhufengensis]|uniref:MFS transporter, PAT family, beta-lactamase induction signal transducer AmpG n=1 Tax=Massilia yuzhufengensis TaxID=1164594 RepID=A0A1I1UDT8_9BURK|nr:MFS transporter [Massilia yuzhufengensis]SFD68991.1 MFS transporter, PAT family, beta-lactamase induction signal transducer AmpG [Massilia yuzhufengensis]
MTAMNELTGSLPPAATRHPLAWVPTLYLAQGLPFYAVALVAGLMFKSMGVPNEQIARWTGVLGLAWVFKALWSPFLELARSKKGVVVSFQLAGGLALGAVALALQLPVWFGVSIALFAVVALASATHDIAADGIYIASLTERQQAAYAGWQGAFFNAAKFLSLGALVILAGYLEVRMGPAQAWATVFGLLGTLMAALGLYHLWALPLGARSGARPQGSARGAATTLLDVVRAFFAKPGIWMAILFIILFRAGEGQIQTIGPLFLRDARAIGGLGLTTAQVGAVYGTAGTIAFLVGSIAGGYFTALLGLRRAMPWLIIAMNLPNAVFWYLSVAQPESLGIIAAGLGVEMFGYGFGFVGVILFIMQVVASGPYQTAHYALGTGFMQLGFVLFKMVSGDIQAALGYRQFFLWVLLAALPVLVLSRFMRLEADGKLSAS